MNKIKNIYSPGHDTSRSVYAEASDNQGPVNYRLGGPYGSGRFTARLRVQESRVKGLAPSLEQLHLGQQHLHLEENLTEHVGQKQELDK